MSEVKVNKVSPRSGTTVTIGDSGDTINIVGTLQNNGSPLAGDISSVVAGTGLSGGATSGVATLNIEASQPTITSLGTITGFTSTGIDDNANALAITIDSSEHTHFGLTSSPSAGQGGVSILNYGTIQSSRTATGNLSHREFYNPNGQVGNIKTSGSDLNINASSSLTFYTNNAEKMRILADGKVGIGTSNPSCALDVNGGSVNGNVFKTTTSGDNNYLAIDNTSTGGQEWVLNSSGNGSGNGGGAFAIQGPDSNTPRLLINSSGNVGIGTTSPGTIPLNVVTTDGGNVDEILELRNNSTTTGTGVRLRLVSSTDAGSIPNSVSISSYRNAGSDHDLLFESSGSEKMRIRSTGLVGIGTSSPSQKLDVNGVISSSSEIRLANAYTKVADADAQGGFAGGYNINVSTNSVQHSVTGDAYGIHFSNSALKFHTNSSASGGTAVPERMRIDSSGNVGIGTTSPSEKLSVAGIVTMGGLQSTYGQKSFIKSSNANNYTLEVHSTAATPASQYIMDVSFTGANPPDNSAAKFFQMRSGGARVNINSDGDIYNHDGTYGTISDERIKQNIVDASSQWEDIKNIRVRRYKKKQDVAQYGEENAPNEIGVISQELETVSPGLIKEDKPDSSHVNLHEDFTGDNPQNVKYVKYSILYMKSIKALQEAMERIETLEAKVTTLENV